MKKIYRIYCSLLFSVLGVGIACPSSKLSQPIQVEIYPKTGALSEIKIGDDDRDMNWILKPDGTQYEWVNENHGWGLGFFTEKSESEIVERKWKIPEKSEDGGMRVNYKEGNTRIDVKREIENNDLIETYTFTNEGTNIITLSKIGINTPFNDNYPDAATCYHARGHAHIWPGQNAAYVNVMHMSGTVPHLGLVVTKGSVDNYEVKERSRQNANSNFRGVLILNPEDITLKPNESYTLSWRIFTHSGNEDFYKKMIEYGSISARSEKYVYEQGEAAYVEFFHSGKIGKAEIILNGRVIPHKKERNKLIAEVQLSELGEAVVELVYDNGKRTPINLLVISSAKNLVEKRVKFIAGRQQLKDKNDKRYGAYMVYDNEGDSIYLNDTPNCNPVDRDEGRERLGMGVLLAMVYRENKDEDLKKSLLEYADFVHKLQDKDYNTFSTTDLTGWNRNYNYSWVANYYFEMFHVTGDKQFLLDGYYTLKALYRNFGHGFYAIDMPTKGYHYLKENGFPEEAASLLEDFKKVGDTYLKNGYHYPISEVNYEQSIVAPSVTHLLRLYLITKEQKYLDGAKEQLPLLEAFGGFQPSYHMNEISIRHWDGYWFGKREFWGDNYPHYWSTLTALAYDLYAEATGEETYRERAKNIVRNNLCLFFEDGRASCAFVYPKKVNGEEAYFYDSYANDQDWAMVYYLMLNK